MSGLSQLVRLQRYLRRNVDAGANGDLTTFDNTLTIDFVNQSNKRLLPDALQDIFPFEFYINPQMMRFEHRHVTTATRVQKRFSVETHGSQLPTIRFDIHSGLLLGATIDGENFGLHEAAMDETAAFHKLMQFYYLFRANGHAYGVTGAELLRNQELWKGGYLHNGAFESLLINDPALIEIRYRRDPIAGGQLRYQGSFQSIQLEHNAGDPWMLKLQTTFQVSKTPGYKTVQTSGISGAETAQEKDAEQRAGTRAENRTRDTETEADPGASIVASLEASNQPIAQPNPESAGAAAVDAAQAGVELGQVDAVPTASVQGYQVGQAIGQARGSLSGLTSNVWRGTDLYDLIPMLTTDLAAGSPIRFISAVASIAADLSSGKLSAISLLRQALLTLENRSNTLRDRYERIHEVASVPMITPEYLVATPDPVNGTYGHAASELASTSEFLLEFPNTAEDNLRSVYESNESVVELQEAMDTVKSLATQYRADNPAYLQRIESAATLAALNNTSLTDLAISLSRTQDVNHQIAGVESFGYVATPALSHLAGAIPSEPQHAAWVMDTSKNLVTGTQLIIPTKFSQLRDELQGRQAVNSDSLAQFTAVMAVDADILDEVTGMTDVDFELHVETRFNGIYPNGYI
jgi:hypothetical protein